MQRSALHRAHIAGAFALCFAVLRAAPGLAEGVSLNFSGAPGLIDMPSGEAVLPNTEKVLKTIRQTLAF